jgi:hypothetical protein
MTKNPTWIGLLAYQLGIPTEEVSDFIHWDFIDQGEEVPTFSELKSHIEYQRDLSAIGTETGWDEHEFADAWCQAY